MSDSVLRDRSKEFAKQIVILCRVIKQEHHESVLTNQLLRSGTAIGANIHEAQYTQGTKDFISKFVQNESENVDKLQTALDAWEENQRQEKLGKLGSDVDSMIDDENAEAEVDDNSVDVNDMISALEA